MIGSLKRIKWRLGSRRCSCGRRLVAKGTSTEINGVKHTQFCCFPCDEYGQPL